MKPKIIFLILFFAFKTNFVLANPIYAAAGKALSTQSGNANMIVVPSGATTYDLCPNTGWKAIRIVNNSGHSIGLPNKTQAEWESILTTTSPGITVSQTCCSQTIIYSSSSSVTIPANCTRLISYAWGAGGAAGVNASASNGSNGAVGGFIYARNDSVTPLSTVQVTPGTAPSGTTAGGGGDNGGTGGAAGAASSGAGGAAGSGAETSPLITAGINNSGGTPSSPGGGAGGAAGKGKYGGGGGGGGGGGANGTGVGPGNGAAGAAGGGGGGASKVVYSSNLFAVAGGGGGGYGGGGTGGTAGLFGAVGANGGIGGAGGSGTSEGASATAGPIVNPSSGNIDTVNGTNITATAATATASVTGVSTIVTTQNAAVSNLPGSVGTAGIVGGASATGGLVVLTFDAP